MSEEAKPFVYTGGFILAISLILASFGVFAVWCESQKPQYQQCQPCKCVECKCCEGCCK